MELHKTVTNNYSMSGNWLPIKDPFQEMFEENQVLTWFVWIFYHTGIISWIGLVFISWFERNGLAGPHRTLPNMLAASKYDQLVIASVVGFAPINYSTVLGPLPMRLCQASSFAILFGGMNVVISSTIIALVRFCMVCLFKSMTSIDEKFWLFSINIIQNVVVFVAVAAKKFL